MQEMTSCSEFTEVRHLPGASYAVFFLLMRYFKTTSSSSSNSFGRQKHAWSVVSEFEHHSTDEEVRLVVLWIETSLAAESSEVTGQTHTSQLFPPLAFNSVFIYHSAIHLFM